MINVAGLAAFFIYTHHNSSASTDKRRKFLKDLSNQLCMPCVENRAANPIVTGNYSVRNALELILKCQLGKDAAEIEEEPTRDKHGRAAVVGSCHLCRIK